jgi:hypothetical protein
MLTSQKMMISALEDRLNTLQTVLIMMSIAFCLNVVLGHCRSKGSARVLDVE